MSLAEVPEDPLPLAPRAAPSQLLGRQVTSGQRLGGRETCGYLETLSRRGIASAEAVVGVS